MPLYSDIDVDAKEALETCDQAKLFRGVSDAIRLLEEKAHFDFSLGSLDISVCNKTVTLPHFVGTVLAVAGANGPTYLRDSWYQHHINGVGVESFTDCGYTDEVGVFSTFRDPAAPSRIVDVVESNADNNKEVRVFGWDSAGKRIYTPGPTGELQDGFNVPTIVGYPLSNPNVPLIARIDRIQKSVTNGFIKLVAIDADNNQVLLGYFEPHERLPQYRRIRLASGSTWARIKYRRAYREIRAATDYIPIPNKLALKLAMRAVKYYDRDKYDMAATAEAQAVRMLSEGQNVNQTPTPIGPQIIYDTRRGDGEEGGLFY